MITRHFGLSDPLKLVRENFVGVLAASVICPVSRCDGAKTPIIGLKAAHRRESMQRVERDG
jgi:hypothetical protein